MAADHPESGANVGDAVTRLEAELASERDEARVLREKLAALEARAGGNAPTGGDDRIAQIEARLREQNRRLETLGSGREQSLAELRQLRQELELVSRERDSLRDELKRIDGMQTETIAFDESRPAGSDVPGSAGAGESGDGSEAAGGPAVASQSAASTDAPGLPTIEELIALNADDQPPPAAPRPAEPLAGEADSASETGWHELLPADLIVAQGPGEAPQRRFADAGRWQFVRTDLDPPETFRLDEPLMTIGRSPSADIQIDAGYISRIHARLLQLDGGFVLEDAGSKNGIRINGERVERRTLKHGDVVQIGAVPFRFVDLDLANAG